MFENLTNEEDLHKRNISSLIGEYGDRLDQSTIKQTYQQMRFRYRDARIRIYVPLLVMRNVKETFSRLPMDVRLNTEAVISSKSLESRGEAVRQ
jgi:hypothetical protein